MNTDERGLAHASLTNQIIGSAMVVLNELGHGFIEKPYENALAVEFRVRHLTFLQQPSYNVMYKGVNVGHYSPDLIVESAVVVDTKVIEHITDHEIGQMLNYLKMTGLKIGLIINFKYAKLQWKRIVL